MSFESYINEENFLEDLIKYPEHYAHGLSEEIFEMLLEYEPRVHNTGVIDGCFDWNIIEPEVKNNFGDINSISKNLINKPIEVDNMLQGVLKALQDEGYDHPEDLGGWVRELIGYEQKYFLKREHLEKTIKNEPKKVR